MASAFKRKSAGYGINEGVHAQPGKTVVTDDTFFSKKIKAGEKKAIANAHLAMRRATETDRLLPLLLIPR